jgi:hypothetical protein
VKNSLRTISIALTALLALSTLSLAQTPTITSISLKENQCTYTVGSSNAPCAIGPGMTLTIEGTGFGTTPGFVNLCDCGLATNVKWGDSQVVALVNWIGPNSALNVETEGGSYSNALPYTALAPVITSITVGDCSYVPNVSKKLCTIAPGSTITIQGKYFGPQSQYGLVSLCDCDDAAVVSWDPSWSITPSAAQNEIIAVATQTQSGSNLAVQANGIWSNGISYITGTCGQ